MREILSDTRVCDRFGWTKAPFHGKKLIMFKQQSPLMKQSLRGAQICLLAAMVGCGPDGSNSKDNTLTGPVKGVGATDPSASASQPTIQVVGSPIPKTLKDASSGVGVLSYQSVVLSNRDVIVVWLESDGKTWILNNAPPAPKGIIVSRYQQSTDTWSSPVALTQNYTMGDVATYKLLRDSNDNVTVIWTQASVAATASAPGGKTDKIFSARYDKATANWTTPFASDVIGKNVGTISALEAALDSSNNITLVWSEDNGAVTPTNHMYGRRCNATGAWDATAYQLDNVVVAARQVSNPQIAVDTSNNVTVIWRQDVGGRYDVFANRYTAGPGWDGVNTLSTAAGGAGSVDNEAMVVDGGGNVTVAWRQSDAGTPSIFNVHYNRWDGATWLATGATRVNTATKSGSEPRLALTKTTNKAFVFWTEDNGTVNDLKVCEAVAAISCSGTIILDNQTTNAGLAEVAADGSGNLVAAWAQAQTAGGKAGVWARRYISGTGWGAAASIVQLSKASPEGDASSPKLYVDSSGNVTAHWLQDAEKPLIYPVPSSGDARATVADSLPDLWSNRFAVVSASWGGAVTVEDLAGGTDDFLNSGGSDTAVVPVSMTGSANPVDFYLSWTQPIWQESVEKDAAGNEKTVYTLGNHILSNRHSALGWSGVRQVNRVANVNSVQAYVDSAGTVIEFWLLPVQVGSSTLKSLQATRFSQ
jgi:hypothetical protein